MASAPPRGVTVAALKRTHKKKLSKAELASVTSSRPVVRKLLRRRNNPGRPGAREIRESKEQAA
jgi:hypothetical protein